MSKSHPPLSGISGLSFKIQLLTNWKSFVLLLTFIFLLQLQTQNCPHFCQSFECQERTKCLGNTLTMAEGPVASCSWLWCSQRDLAGGMWKVRHIHAVVQSWTDCVLVTKYQCLFKCLQWACGPWRLHQLSDKKTVWWSCLRWSC